MWELNVSGSFLTFEWRISSAVLVYLMPLWSVCMFVCLFVTPMQMVEMDTIESLIYNKIEFTQLVTVKRELLRIENVCLHPSLWIKVPAALILEMKRAYQSFISMHIYVRISPVELNGPYFWMQRFRLHSTVHIIWPQECSPKKYSIPIQLQTIVCLQGRHLPLWNMSFFGKAC